VKVDPRSYFLALMAWAVLWIFPFSRLAAQDAHFHNAPTSSERNGVRLPEDVLDRMGVPGVKVKGKVFDADGLRALAVEGLAR